MRQEDFNKAIKEQLSKCELVLVRKCEEYALDTNDRLAHFKKAAALTGRDPKEALLGMLAKHLISVSDMCTDGRAYTQERWSEKITDSINYLLILRALVEEEAVCEKN